MELPGIIRPWQIVLILLSFVGLLFPILSLLSILKNEFPGSNKIGWVLVMLLLPILGSLL